MNTMDDLNQSIQASVEGFVHGWCSVDKALKLAEHIIACNAELAVEIGVYSGRSIVPMAMAMRHLGRGMVVGIDPWKKDNAAEGNCSEADKAWWGSINLNDIHNYCIQKIGEHGLDQWCCLIRCQSHYCHTLFDNHTLHRRDKIIDLLHIDGCHSEEASTRDVELYVPRVRNNGVIFFDDVSWTTTTKAQAMMGESCDKIDQIGDCAIFKKRQ